MEQIRPNIQYLTEAVATLLAGGMSLAGGVTNTLVGAGSNRSTNAVNRGIAGEQNQAAIDLWREQSRYNTPSAQVARLRAAGLNPALMYGSMSDAGNADAAPAMAGARMLPFQPQENIGANVANTMADTHLKLAQADTLGNQSSLLLEQLGLTKQEAEAVRLANSIRNYDLKALQDAAEEGLISTAFKAKLRRAVNDANLSQMAYLNSVMNLALDWNVSVADAAIMGDVTTSPDGKRVGSAHQEPESDDTGRYFMRVGDYVIKWDPKTLSSKLTNISTSLGADISENELRKVVADLERNSKRGESDLFDWLNDKIDNGSRAEKVLAYVLYGAIEVAKFVGGSHLSVGGRRENTTVNYMPANN